MPQPAIAGSDGRDDSEDPIKEALSLLIEEWNENEKTKESKQGELDSWLNVLRRDRELGKNEVSLSSSFQ